MYAAEIRLLPLFFVGDLIESLGSGTWSTGSFDVLRLEGRLVPLFFSFPLDGLATLDTEPTS